jgi:hypothetical protein
MSSQKKKKNEKTEDDQKQFEIRDFYRTSPIYLSETRKGGDILHCTEQCFSTAGP